MDSLGPLPSRIGCVMLWEIFIQEIFLIGWNSSRTIYISGGSCPISIHGRTGCGEYQHGTESCITRSVRSMIIASYAVYKDTSFPLLRDRSPSNIYRVSSSHHSLYSRHHDYIQGTNMEFAQTRYRPGRGGYDFRPSNGCFP